MILALRFAFIGVLIAMLAVTSWASLQVPLWSIPASVGGHPWFIATLFDTYFAFFTIWLWIAYKERGRWARWLWLVGILLLGNIAIAAYLLRELFRLPMNAPIQDLLVRRHPNP